MPIRKSTAVTLLAAVLVCSLLLVAQLVAAQQQQQQQQLPSTSHSAEQRSKFKSMNIASLKAYLSEREAGCPGCVEKGHLVDRALEVYDWMTADDRVAMQLTPLQQSAETHMAAHHISTLPLPTDEQIRQMHQQQLAMSQVVCQKPFANGTQYCYNVASYGNGNVQAPQTE